jgi:hypothetical protein
MAEITYAGYVPTSRPDYSALSNELAEKIYGVLDKRQEKREKLDEVERVNQKLLNSWIPGKNQTSNDFILNGLDNARKNLLQWNKDLKAGKITESEYIRRNRNLEENYQMLINVFKSKDERVDAVMQRQEPDENGNIAAPDYEVGFLLKEFGDDVSMKGKQLKVDESGGMYAVEVDPATGLVTNQIKDVRAMANPDNLVGVKVDLISAANKATENWSPDLLWRDLGLKGEENVETIKGKGGYDQLIARTINSIAPDSNPRAQLSILTDNGVFNTANGFEIGDIHEYVKSEEEYNQALQQKIDEELQTLKDAGKTGEELKVSPERMKKLQDLIIVWGQNENGAWMPRLTDEQVKLAKDAVKNQVEFNFSEKVTGTPKTVYKTTNVTNNRNNDNKDQEDPAKFSNLVKAWKSKDPFALELMLNNKDYTIGYNKNGTYTLYAKDELGELKPKHTSAKIDETFMRVFFGSSANQIEEGERQEKQYWTNYNRGKSGTTQKAPKVNAGKAPRPTTKKG